MSFSGAYNWSHTGRTSRGKEFGAPVPVSEYFKKIEVTPLYEEEPSTQVENHIRGLLVDYKPDEPFLAAGEVRGNGEDDYGYGTHSREFLNLRHHGARTGHDPYLPDGSFLDHVFTERDPRGSALGPDMRQHARQQYSRGAFINLYNDEDLSVPENGVSPEEMTQRKSSGFYQFKDRYNNFETAKDNFHNGSSGLRGHKKVGDIAKYTKDGTIVDIADSTLTNRKDATAALSADPRVAYRHSTPDHRFKVAKYGKVRASQYMHDNDWSNNRYSVYYDHNAGVLVKGINVNRQLANLFFDLEGQRQARQEFAKGTDYGSSSATFVRQSQLPMDDVYKILMITGSGALPHHIQLNGEMKNHIMREIENNRHMMDEVKINHHITKSMEQATKTQKDNKRKDLRNNIAQTAADQGLYQESKNKSRVDSMTSRNTQSIDYTHYVEPGKVTMNYGGIKPSQNNRVFNKMKYEGYGSGSDTGRGTARNNQQRKQLNAGSYNPSQKTREFGLYNKAQKASAKSHRGRRQYQLDVGDMDVGYERQTVQRGYGYGR